MKALLQGRKINFIAIKYKRFPALHNCICISSTKVAINDSYHHTDDYKLTTQMTTRMTTDIPIIPEYEFHSTKYTCYNHLLHHQDTVVSNRNYF